MIIETPQQSEIVLQHLNSDNYRERPIKANYPNYEVCFLAFNPFLKIKVGHEDKIKFETRRWPNKQLIIEHCDSINWTELLKISGITSYKKLSRSLLFSEGAIRYCDKNEYKKLNDLFKDKTIIRAQPDDLPEIIENKVLNFIKSKGYSSVNISSDTSSTYSKIEIDKITNGEFVLPYQPRIITDDEKILIVVNFDCFFTYYFGSAKIIEELVTKINLDGFYCDDKTTENWNHEDIPLKNRTELKFT